MEVFIDADGCPVVDITISICKGYKIPVTIICDCAHIFDKEYATTITVDKGADSADFRLVNLVHSGDIVITQDYGLAAMCLARKAKVVSQNGMEYNNDNIDSLLLARHTAKKIRNSGGRLSGPKKRTEQQNVDFKEKFTEIINESL